MINYCYLHGCKNKNICVIYNTLLKYQQDIAVDINSCKYLTGNQQVSINSRDFTSLTERTEKIKTLSHTSNVNTVPNTVKDAKRLGMQFNIDDRDVS